MTSDPPSDKGRPAFDPMEGNGLTRPHLAAEVYAIAIADFLAAGQRPFARLQAIIAAAAAHGARAAAVVRTPAMAQFTAETAQLDEAARREDLDAVAAGAHRLSLLRTRLTAAAQQNQELRRTHAARMAAPSVAPAPQFAAPPPAGADPAAGAKPDPAAVERAVAALRLSPNAPERDEAAFRAKLEAMDGAALKGLIQLGHQQVVQDQRRSAPSDRDRLEAAALRHGLLLAIEVDKERSGPAEGGPAEGRLAARRPPRPRGEPER